MPVLQRDSARIYYEDIGCGEPIIAIHGLAQNSSFWSISGLSPALACKYRFISMDMRAHGRTAVADDSKGFNVETVVDDIEALADFLGFEHFHLLGHSTGGMAAVHLAMRSNDRLISLMLMDTSSATTLIAGNEQARIRFMERFAASFEDNSWDDIIAYTRKYPHPLFNGLDKQKDSEKIWRAVEIIMKQNDRISVGAFVRSFYTDPDPKIAALRQIKCPTLVLLGKLDKLMLEPSEIMAREIPGARHVLLEGVGHMSAIEAPERTLETILNFLETL